MRIVKIIDVLGSTDNGGLKRSSVSLRDHACSSSSLSVIPRMKYQNQSYWTITSVDEQARNGGSLDAQHATYGSDDR